MKIIDNDKGPVLKQLVDLQYHDADRGYALCESATLGSTKDKSSVYLKLILIDRNGSRFPAYMFNYTKEGATEQYLDRLSDSLVFVSLERTPKRFISILSLDIKKNTELKQGIKRELIRYSSEPEVNLSEYISPTNYARFEEDFPEDLRYMDYNIYNGYTRRLSNGRGFLRDVLSVSKALGLDVGRYFAIINVGLKLYVNYKNNPLSRLQSYNVKRVSLGKVILDDAMLSEFDYLVECLLFNEEPKTLLALILSQAVNSCEKVKDASYLVDSLKKGERTSEWVKLD